jgi:NAD(P)-dependent dehydrogenase (short-subunit alcohol dehydrogenase family)
VVLVTGAANGIGRATAKQLLTEGWTVVGLDLPRAGLSRSFRGARNVVTIEGNVAEESTAQRVAALLGDKFGRLDGLVSNAGIMRRNPLPKRSLQEWRQVIDTNLTATFLLARALEKLLRRSHGAIVTIASTRALMSEPDTEAYAASKGGIVALTHALAVSLGPDVRVNCISPGWIKTTDYRELRKKDHAQHPAGRVGKPEDIAGMVSFLLDPDRSAFITGANFVVDGGMTRKMIYEE